MTLYSDLIAETRHHLMTAQPDRINVLDADITSTIDTLVLRYENKGVADGSRLAIGLEEMNVLSVTTTGDFTTCVVIRGVNGSTPALHSEGDHVYVNPQFSDFRIAKYINHGLNSLSGEGLFQIRNTELTSSTVLKGYELVGMVNFIDVWRVRYDEIGTINNWPILRPDEYKIDHAADTTDFPSGQAIILLNQLPTARPIHISYRAGFVPLVNLTDNVLTVSGLHTEAHDLPPMYAAICLLAGREIKRTFLTSQPEPRRQEEVPVGAANQSMNPIVKRYYDRVDIEIKRLRRMYPGAH